MSARSASSTDDVELAQAGLDRRFVAGELGALVAQTLGLRLQPGELVAGEVQPDGAQLVDEAVVAAGRVGLLLQRREPAADLAQQVVQAEQVALGRLEPALGLLAALPVLEDPGGLLDDRAPVLGAGVAGPRRAGPGPTITCCWRPIPVSESSSWMSSRRHGAPLIAYSDSPLRNSVRVIVTSENSIGSRFGGVVDRERHLGPARAPGGPACPRR